MTDHDQSHAIAAIQACEAAITRFRAAIGAGTSDSEAAAADITFILETVKGRLIRYAKQAASFGPGAFEEALDALRDQLLEDIWSPTYPTMETQFGAYLKTRPLRVLQQIARKHGRTSVSPYLERLDHPADSDGSLLSDTLADPKAEEAIDQIADAEAHAQQLAQLEAAINALPDQERFVVQQRRAGLSNNQIAASLGVSPATATRIYQRAVERLRRRMAPDGGEA